MSNIINNFEITNDFTITDGSVQVKTNDINGSLDISGNIAIGSSTSDNSKLIVENINNSIIELKANNANDNVSTKSITNKSGVLEFSSNASLNTCLYEFNVGDNDSVGFMNSIGNNKPGIVFGRAGTVSLSVNDYSNAHIFYSTEDGGSDYNALNFTGEKFIFNTSSENFNTLSQAMIIDANGNVGMGTSTSPTVSFEVGGVDAIRIPYGTTEQRPQTNASGCIRYNTDNSSYEGFGAGSTWGSLGGVKDVDRDTYISAETKAGDDNDQLKFYTVGTEKMIIDKNGNVGIGTPSPSTKLHVLDAGTGSYNAIPLLLESDINNRLTGEHSATSIQFKLKGGGGGPAYNFIGQKMGGNYVYGIGIGSGSDVRTATNSLWVESNKVGIGTTAPSEKLEVMDGNISIQKILSSVENSDIGAIKFKHNAGGIVANLCEIVGVGDSDGYVSGIAYQQSGRLEFRTLPLTNGNLSSSFTPLTRMTVDSNGNVGIGTSSPSAKLTIFGTGGNQVAQGLYGLISFVDNDTVAEARNWFVGPYRSNKSAFQIIPSSVNLGGSPDVSKTFCISYNGNVGIGTTTPHENLVIFGEDATLRIDSNTSGNKTTRFQMVHSGTTTISAASPILGFEIQLDSNITPARTYFGHYNGSATFNKHMTIYRTNGNVGIGTDSPSTSYKLEVNGNIKGSALHLTTSAGLRTWGTGSIILGHLTDGTAVGQYSVSAGKSNTSGGNYSVAMGFGNSTGYSSVAMGESNTSTGGGSVAMGKTNTSGGYYSVAMGRTNTSKGDNSVAMGIYSHAEKNYSMALGNRAWAGDNIRFAIGISDTANNTLANYGNNYGNNNKFVIDVNGKVGIGTDTPQRTFHLDGQLTVRSGTQEGLLFWNAPNNTYMDINKITGTTGSSTHTIRFHTAGHSYFNGGNVGIGITSPSYKLDVAGTMRVTGALTFSYAPNPRIYNVSTSTHYRLAMTTAGYGVGGDALFSPSSWGGPMYKPAENKLYVNSIALSSDRRIKKDIRPMPDALALDILRRLDVKYYNYIEEKMNGTHEVIGFIAQEVLDILPSAVIIDKGTIPYLMSDVNVMWENSTDGYIMTVLLQTLEPGEYSFVMDSEKLVMLSTMDGTTFKTANKYSKVYISGKTIDDFHRIDKTKIFAVGYAATQEIDRIQQQEKAKLVEQEAKLATAEAKLATAETEITTLKNNDAVLLNKIATLESNFYNLQQQVQALINN